MKQFDPFQCIIVEIVIIIIAIVLHINLGKEIAPMIAKEGEQTDREEIYANSRSVMNLQ